MKYPIILQRNCNDCGPACIYTLCEYYNIPYNQKDILSQIDLTPKGTSIWNMQLALKSLGFSCKAVYIEDFFHYDFSIPIIALIKANNILLHYVVIYQKTENTLLVGDPSSGLQYILIKKFLSKYTNMAIIPQIIIPK